MQRLRFHPTLLIDLVGGALLVLMAALFLSMTVFAQDDTVAQIDTMDRSIAEARRSLALVRANMDQSDARLRLNQRRLASQGRLPEAAPVDDYFRYLSSIATQNHLTVRNQIPLGERQYPGLKETPFTYEVTGSWPDLIRFLEAIENAPYWADVGYLTIHPVADQPEVRRAQLTVCLFSVTRPQETHASEKG